MMIMKRFLQTLVMITVALSGAACSWMDERNSITDVAAVYNEVNGSLTSRIYNEVTMPYGDKILVEKKPSLNEKAIKNIELVEVDVVNPTLSPEMQRMTAVRKRLVLLEMTEEGTRRLYTESVANQGRRFVMTHNNAYVGYYYISGPIADGKIYMTVEMSDEDMEDMVFKLKQSLPKIAEIRDRRW